MKKIILLILFFISLTLLTLRFGNSVLNSVLGTSEKSGLKISSTPSLANVFIDGVMVGKTPFESGDLQNKQYDIKVESGKYIWQARVKLIGGTITVINRDLSEDPTSAAGEILSLEKGSGVVILSTPSGAEVQIDGKAVGNTPGKFEVEVGEHIFNLSHQNFLKRSIRAYVPDKYSLTLNVDLGITEADLTNTSTPVISQTPKVVVKSTPTGFLRVRDKPSLQGSEISKVSPGDELDLLEEGANWHKVKLSNGAEGYVSVTYVEKKTP